MFDEEPFRSMYKETHDKNQGKFKVGTTVVYVGTFFPEYTDKEFVILASNVQDEEHTEYLLEGFPFLVYENEIEEKI